LENKNTFREKTDQILIHCMKHDTKQP